MSYEIDRNPKNEPSLTEMALKALDDLYAATKYSEKGFFIMVEASRIVCPCTFQRYLYINSHVT